MENLKENESKSKYNKLAKIAFILSISSLVLTRISYVLGLVTILAGFIIGIIAIKNMRHTKEKGKGLAITSIVVGGIFLAIIIISAISFILLVFKK